jgi:hypothetical protein
MAQPARQQQTLTEQDEKRIAEEAKAIQKQEETEPERQGSILGLSDASPAVEIPRVTDDRIELDDRIEPDDLAPATTRRDLNE